MHDEPLFPQMGLVFPGRHTPTASQQPVAQVDGPQLTQLPVEHEAPEPHEPQEAPPLPHALVEVPDWQTPFWSQQPEGHVEGLQLAVH